VGHIDEQRLKRLLGGPDLKWVLDRARRRVELGQPLTGTVVLNGASSPEREAVAGLFGRPLREGRALSVSLGELDALLRRSGVHDGGLRAAIEVLSGPVEVRADRVAAESRDWAEAFERLATAAAGRPALASWVETVRARGLVKRLTSRDPVRGRELLEGVEAVVAALPANGEPLGAFSARVTGQAHALDDGSPLGTLALGAARAIAELPPLAAEESAGEARRETWAAVGVLCDELSSTVLTLGLQGGEDSVTGRLLDCARTGGEPVWLTLRQLVRDPPRWPKCSGAGTRVVSVVENPAMVALAADRLGSRSGPVVCTNGQPRAATMVLLRGLAAAGFRLRHHGDFDWGGLTIGNLLHRRLPLEPWRFDREAYLEAASLHPHAGALTGAPVTASWDPGLSDAMRAEGRRIEEELVAASLLKDLPR
jgi:uncharacterized protein (TIGR02679 family)